MTLDVRAYWAGSVDPVPTSRPGWETQEIALQSVLGAFSDAQTALDVGCGRGRTAKLLLETLPNAAYTGLDIGHEQIAATRAVRPDGRFIHIALQDWEPFGTWDVVVASEVLMHIPPDEVQAVFGKLHNAAGRALVTVDWTPDRNHPTPAPWNWAHDYAAWEPSWGLSIAEQTIYGWEKEGR